MAQIDIEILEKGEHVWVENSANAMSRFVHQPTGLKYLFEPYGIAGSVVEVPKRVANDPYFRRAVARGKLRVLTAEQAEERLASLKLPDETEEESYAARVAEGLSKGAAERTGSHYKREDLPEFGVSKSERTIEEVWGAAPTPKASTLAADVKRVPDAFDDNGLAPSPTDIEGYGEVEIERVREDGWDPEA